MRLVAAICAASLAWSVISAGLVGEIVAQLDATLLQRVAVALH